MHYRRNARPHGRARRRGIAIADEDIPHRLARRRHRSRCRLSRQRRLSAGPARRWLRRGAQRGDRVSLATGNVDRLPQLATELVRAPVDVIVTSGEPAAIAAKQATKTIPIIVTQIGADPVKAGLVTSLARPGGNVTGLATLNEELWAKRLGLLKEVAPNVSRLAVLWNPANPGNASCIEEIKGAAQTLQLQVVSVEVRDAKALDRALASITNDSANALAACWDSMLLERAGAIAEFALKRRLPTLAPLKEFVEEGFLLSLGASLPAHKRRAAYYVDKVLKGAKPADLPVERATLFELVVNLKTAKALGFALPPTLLVLADDVIR